MAYPFKLRFQGIPIGCSFLEHGDAPMCCASGAFIASREYARVRDRIVASRLSAGHGKTQDGLVQSNDGELRIFDREGLEVLSPEGTLIAPAVGIYLADYRELGVSEAPDLRAAPVELHIEGLDPDLYGLFFRAHVEGYRARWQIDVVESSVIATDAEIVVNSANSALSGGGGVDTVIHRAAGPELLEECLKSGHRPVGDAVLTSGHALRARWVIHAIGPAWEGGDHREVPLLARCHRRVFEIARQTGAKSIALPAISCGAHRFPPALAASVAIRAAYEHVVEAGAGNKVVFCIPDAATRACFNESLHNA